MHPQYPSPRLLLLAIAAITGVSFAAESTTTVSTTTPVATLCVATATSGAFFDLRPDTAVIVAEGEKHHKGIHTEDYVARGWDYGSNFTLNICDAVVKKIGDVVGVEESLWRNVSAYYKVEGKVYSLGYDINSSRLEMGDINVTPEQATIRRACPPGAEARSPIRRRIAMRFLRQEKGQAPRYP